MEEGMTRLFPSYTVLTKSLSKGFIYQYYLLGWNEILAYKFWGGANIHITTLLIVKIRDKATKDISMLMFFTPKDNEAEKISGPIDYNSTPVFLRKGLI